MAVSRTKAYKDTKKLEYKTSIREGTFIADYVKTKYSQIYEEAAALYNSINKLHPNKPNLREINAISNVEESNGTSKRPASATHSQAKGQIC